MNDFTKEELETLKIGLGHVEDRSAENEDTLRKKIQSLIDNYCEHQSLDYVGDVSGYDCKKCGKRFDYEYVGDERHERIMAGEEE